MTDGNLISTGFARTTHARGARGQGRKMTGLRPRCPTRAPSSQTRSRRSSARACSTSSRARTTSPAHVVADGWFTNKAPGGVAYRCSFRVTEASYLIERLVDNAAHELGVDLTRFRLDNFIQPEQFPYHSATGFVYDSGTTPRRCGSRSRRSATRACGASRTRRARRGVCSASGSRRSRRSSARATARSTTSPVCGCSTRRSSACTPPARRS